MDNRCNLLCSDVTVRYCTIDSEMKKMITSASKVLQRKVSNDSSQQISGLRKKCKGGKPNIVLKRKGFETKEMSLNEDYLELSIAQNQCPMVVRIHKGFKSALEKSKTSSKMQGSSTTISWPSFVDAGSLKGTKTSKKILEKHKHRRKRQTSFNSDNNKLNYKIAINNDLRLRPKEIFTNSHLKNSSLKNIFKCTRISYLDKTILPEKSTEHKYSLHPQNDINVTNSVRNKFPLATNKEHRKLKAVVKNHSFEIQDTITQKKKIKNNFCKKEMELIQHHCKQNKMEHFSNVNLDRESVIAELNKPQSGQEFMLSKSFQKKLKKNQNLHKLDDCRQRSVPYATSIEKRKQKAIAAEHAPGKFHNTCSVSSVHVKTLKDSDKDYNLRERRKYHTLASDVVILNASQSQFCKITDFLKKRSISKEPNNNLLPLEESFFERDIKSHKTDVLLTKNITEEIKEKHIEPDIKETTKISMKNYLQKKKSLVTPLNKERFETLMVTDKVKSGTQNIAKNLPKHTHRCNKKKTITNNLNSHFKQNSKKRPEYCFTIKQDIHAYKTKIQPNTGRFVKNPRVQEINKASMNNFEYGSCNVPEYCLASHKDTACIRQNIHALDKNTDAEDEIKHSLNDSIYLPKKQFNSTSRSKPCKHSTVKVNDQPIIQSKQQKIKEFNKNNRAYLNNSPIQQKRDNHASADIKIKHTSTLSTLNEVEVNNTVYNDTMCLSDSFNNVSKCSKYGFSKEPKSDKSNQLEDFSNRKYSLAYNVKDDKHNKCVQIEATIPDKPEEPLKMLNSSKPYYSIMHANTRKQIVDENNREYILRPKDSIYSDEAQIKANNSVPEKKLSMPKTSFLLLKNTGFEDGSFHNLIDPINNNLKYSFRKSFSNISLKGLKNHYSNYNFSKTNMRNINVPVLPELSGSNISRRKENRDLCGVELKDDKIYSPAFTPTLEIKNNLEPKLQTDASCFKRYMSVATQTDLKSHETKPSLEIESTLLTKTNQQTSFIVVSQDLLPDMNKQIKIINSSNKSNFTNISCSNNVVLEEEKSVVKSHLMPRYPAAKNKINLPSNASYLRQDVKQFKDPDHSLLDIYKRPLSIKEMPAISVTNSEERSVKSITFSDNTDLETKLLFKSQELLEKSSNLQDLSSCSESVLTQGISVNTDVSKIYLQKKCSSLNINKTNSVSNNKSSQTVQSENKEKYVNTISFWNCESLERVNDETNESSSIAQNCNIPDDKIVLKDNLFNKLIASEMQFENQMGKKIIMKQLWENNSEFENCGFIISSTALLDDKEQANHQENNIYKSDGIEDKADVTTLQSFSHILFNISVREKVNLKTSGNIDDKGSLEMVVNLINPLPLETSLVLMPLKRANSVNLNATEEIKENKHIPVQRSEIQIHFDNNICHEDFNSLSNKNAQINCNETEKANKTKNKCITGISSASNINKYKSDSSITSNENICKDNYDLLDKTNNNKTYGYYQVNTTVKRDSDMNDFIESVDRNKISLTTTKPKTTGQKIYTKIESCIRKITHRKNKRLRKSKS